MKKLQSMLLKWLDNLVTWIQNPETMVKVRLETTYLLYRTGLYILAVVIYGFIWAAVVPSSTWVGLFLLIVHAGVIILDICIFDTKSISLKNSTLVLAIAILIVKPTATTWNDCFLLYTIATPLWAAVRWVLLNTFHLPNNKEVTFS